MGILFGNPETTPGGRALKFYSTIRLDVRKGEAIKNGSEIIGNVVNIKVVKNKVASPFKTASVDLVYGLGINREGEVLDLAANNDIVKKSGAWYDYNGERIGQGREAAKKYLIEHNEILMEIENKVREKLGLSN